MLLFFFNIGFSSGKWYNKTSKLGHLKLRIISIDGFVSLVIGLQELFAFVLRENVLHGPSKCPRRSTSVPSIRHSDSMSNGDSADRLRLPLRERRVAPVRHKDVIERRHRQHLI